MGGARLYNADCCLHVHELHGEQVLSLKTPLGASPAARASCVHIHTWTWMNMNPNSTQPCGISPLSPWHAGHPSFSNPQTHHHEHGPTFMAAEVTSVRSDARVHQRMMDHMGCTSSVHVYLGMYSGMCVWYETTRGMRSSLAYMVAAKTSRPGEETWMIWGRDVTRWCSTRALRPSDSSSVGLE